MNVKAVATVIKFCKGLVTRGSIWFMNAFGIILVTRSPFQKFRCEHRKKHFSQQILIAGSIFFNLEKIKLIFFK